MTKPSVLVDVQLALNKGVDHPSVEQLSIWAELAATGQIQEPSELTIRLVHEAEISQLNQRYRGKAKSTNVLSFPIEEQDEVVTQMFSHRPIGDVIICHDVIMFEAESQGKSVHDHYAHMVTHGILHLCGYDHIDERDALEMEALEVAVLARSEIANPYL